MQTQIQSSSSQQIFESVWLLLFLSTKVKEFQPQLFHKVFGFWVSLVSLSLRELFLSLQVFLSLKKFCHFSQSLLYVLFSKLLEHYIYTRAHMYVDISKMNFVTVLLRINLIQNWTVWRIRKTKSWQRWKEL